jgi:hypothetical protein
VYQVTNFSEFFPPASSKEQNAADALGISRSGVVGEGDRSGVVGEDGAARGAGRRGDEGDKGVNMARGSDAGNLQTIFVGVGVGGSVGGEGSPGALGPVTSSFDPVTSARECGLGGKMGGNAERVVGGKSDGREGGEHKRYVSSSSYDVYPPPHSDGREGDEHKKNILESQYPIGLLCKTTTTRPTFEHVCRRD